ncbi:uncharacterized protein LOC108860320 [Raphanus sativus]|uniref:Uncharacterized protein LOC108860320 n=1 Tax=Raphanus sativus TaxID=3726 RepID=A0A9W3DRU5_RAPSA|nr:uncharacterized protein LOC108860320 [Raphanus sativus]
MSLLDWGKAEIRFRLIHVSEARNTTEVGVLIGLGLLLIYEQVGTWCREEPLKDEIRAKRRCAQKYCLFFSVYLSMIIHLRVYLLKRQLRWCSLSSFHTRRL